MISAIVTGSSGIVTDDSGQRSKMGHDETERPVTFLRNRRSRSSGMNGHNGAEYATMRRHFKFIDLIAQKLTLNCLYIHQKYQQVFHHRVMTMLRID